MMTHTEIAAAPSITYHMTALFGSAGGVTGEDDVVPAVVTDDTVAEGDVVFRAVVTFVEVVWVGVVET